DHRDARTHETPDREDRDAGPQRERRVGVAQVVQATQRLDAGSHLSGLPVTTAETRKSIRPPRAFGNRIGFADRGSRSSASTAIAGRGTARVLSRVSVCLTRPFAYPRRTYTTPSSRSMSRCSSANSSDGRSPIAAENLTIGP